MRNLYKYLLLAAVIVYVLSPVDVLPGPVDDLIVIILTAAARGDELRRCAQQLQ